MIKHYTTKYEENGTRYAESWLQLNLFGKCYCFSKRKTELGHANIKDSKTCELVEELKNREGVEMKWAEPYKDLEVKVNGPAIVLVVID